MISFSYDERRAAYLSARGRELDQSRGYIVSAIVDWWFEHMVDEPLRKETVGKFPQWPGDHAYSPNQGPQNRHNM